MRKLFTVAGPVVACLLAALYGACSDEETSPMGGGANGAGTANGGNNVGGGDGGLGLGGFQVGGQGEGGGIEGCDPQDFTLDKGPPPEIYLVIDSSGSMNSLGSGTDTKWQELVTAVDGALQTYEGAIEFGLLRYPIDQICTVPTAPQVAPPALNARTAILAALNISPNGGTPTADSLEVAAESLLAVGDPEEPDFLILATDGGPNCNDALNLPCSCTYVDDTAYCCTNYPSSTCQAGMQCLDDAHTLDVITSFHNQGIDTFVIGLPGTASFDELLDAMAVAGGRPQQNASTQYYNATSPTELAAALDAIASQTISCTITLTEAPENPDAVYIYIDEQDVPRDPDKQNGWDYTDDSHLTIELYGSYCDTIQDGEEHVVTATFACEVR